MTERDMSPEAVAAREEWRAMELELEQQAEEHWRERNGYTRTITTRHTLPAGEYYVGDLCYVVPELASNGEDLWRSELRKEWQKTTGSSTLNSLEAGELLVAPHPEFDCVRAFTAYGDGGYRGSDGFLYDVDSGTIGVVKVNDAIKAEFEKQAGSYGTCNHIVFEEDFDFWVEDPAPSWNADNLHVIHIGHISIPTGWSRDEDDEDDEDYEDED